MQVNLPKEIHVLISKLMLKRQEADVRPCDVTKSAVVADAITAAATAAGIVSEPEPGK